MPLQIRQDFKRMSHLIANEGGDLVTPLAPLFWPTSTSDEENLKRARWSMNQQRAMFQEDPSAIFLKVVDTDHGDEVLSLARWHFYEHGYKHSEFTAWELNGKGAEADSTWPEEVNVPVARATLIPVFEARSGWMGQGRQWVLTTLITRESKRRQGAGGMLVEWGVQRALRDDCPAFMEATAAGAPLYAKFGFRKIGEQTLRLEEFGLDDVPLARMAANLPDHRTVGR